MSGQPNNRLTAIVAMTPSGVIGRDGDMPWHLSSDLRRFKRLTMGGVLIMGRRTFDSIGRPLPGRETIVITRNSDWAAEGVHRATSPEEAVELGLELLRDKLPTDHPKSSRPGVFVVGGAEIYRQLLPHCDRLELTWVWSAVQGDTKLTIDLSQFRIIEQTRMPATCRDSVPSKFLRMIRI